jgi:hypothetical protein
MYERNFYIELESLLEDEGPKPSKPCRCRVAVILPVLLFIQLNATLESYARRLAVMNGTSFEWPSVFRTIPKSKQVRTHRNHTNPLSKLIKKIG